MTTKKEKTDRTERLETRLTPDEKDLIRRASEHAGIDPAVAVRQEAIAWARWILDGPTGKGGRG